MSNTDATNEPAMERDVDLEDDLRTHIELNEELLKQVDGLNKKMREIQDVNSHLRGDNARLHKTTEHLMRALAGHIGINLHTY